MVLVRQERIDGVNIGRRAIAADRPHIGRQLDRRLQMDTVIKASAMGCDVAGHTCTLHEALHIGARKAIVCFRNGLPVLCQHVFIKFGERAERRLLNRHPKGVDSAQFFPVMDDERIGRSAQAGIQCR